MTTAGLRGGRSSLDLVLVFLSAFLIFGCSGDDGLDGLDGLNGVEGAAGVNCWDLNENGVKDPEEDLNGDGEVDVVDCNAVASGISKAEKLHTGYFTENAYEGTDSCLDCHGLEGADMLMKAHYTWEGLASNIEGYEDQFHGKNDLINNFCIAVPTNEPRCTQCHAGYGYADKTFAFNDPESVDCLICHDQTDTYAKGLKTAGLPATDEEGNLKFDIDAVARSVAMNEGVPQIKNCIVCHANAGGGDNVKHGDLAMALLTDATRDDDVHMGAGSKASFNCVACHESRKNSEDELLEHGMGGMAFHSTDEGVMKTCEDCHGDVASIHVGTSVTQVTDSHTQLACQVCHIPTIARITSTKTEWYWSDAGQDISPIPTDPVTGRPTYDKKKGTFVWKNNVRPTLLYSDGKWNRKMIGTNESFTTTPVDLGSPSADYTTPGAKIYPFKKMIGDQVADADNNIMLVPHLFGMKGGPNPYWGKFDWDLALRDGAAYTGQPYSGNYEFVDTFMYLSVNHEVAPAEQAYGKDGACADCHLDDQIDWQALGWTDDPISLIGGTRPPAP